MFFRRPRSSKWVRWALIHLSQRAANICVGPGGMLQAWPATQSAVGSVTAATAQSLLRVTCPGAHGRRTPPHSELGSVGPYDHLGAQAKPVSPWHLLAKVGICSSDCHCHQQRTRPICAGGHRATRATAYHWSPGF